MNRHLFVTLFSVCLAGCMGGRSSGSSSSAPPPEPERSARASTGGEEAPEPTPEEVTPRDRELVRSLAGEWQLAQSDAEARIDHAISEVTGQMSFFARGIANDRIDEAVDPDERVSIEVPDGEHVVVAIGQAEPARLELNGPPVRATGVDGQPVSRRAVLRGEHLVIEERTAQGTRTLTFAPRGDALVVSTRIRADQLPDAIEYDLRYRRGAGGEVARR